MGLDLGQLREAVDGPQLEHPAAAGAEQGVAARQEVQRAHPVLVGRVDGLQAGSRERKTRKPSS